MKYDEITNIGKAINSFLEKNNLKIPMMEDKVRINWEEWMGKPIASATEKLWIKDGVLYLKIHNPTWKNELQYAKGKIKKIINENLEYELIKSVKVF